MWRRHNRHLTKEVFYDGTTIDGSRLEKAMRFIQERVNRVRKGDMQKRFVAVQYCAGYLPSVGAAAHFPWLEIRNQATVDTAGELPDGAPYNPARLKGTHVPGIELNTNGGTRVGTQWAWSRTFAFQRPAVLEGVSLMMQLDSGTDPHRPYTGSRSAGAASYSYGTTPPAGIPANWFTADVSLIVDVFNPTTPEDPEMTSVVYTRNRWVINRDVFSVFTADPTGTGWDDMTPVFETNYVTGARTLSGILKEDEGLNIPLPAGSKVRLSVVLPGYDGTVVSITSWGAKPWDKQGWNLTMTVLEEVQSL